MSFWKRFFSSDGPHLRRVRGGKDYFDDSRFEQLKRRGVEVAFVKGWRYYPDGNHRVFQRAAEPYITGRGILAPTQAKPPPPGSPVDKSNWKPCHRCGRKIPVCLDHMLLPDGTLAKAQPYTYACPFCGHCHAGNPCWDADTKSQDRCHECGTQLNNAFQCPNCSLPRGWARMTCEHCGNRQLVHAPHWVCYCDCSVVECVQCERITYGLCIC